MREFLKTLLLCLTLSAVSVNARSQTVSNVKASQRGNDIEVSYYLDRPATGVQLRVSTDGGRTFSLPLRMVTGSVGDVSSGYQKIIWDVQSEYGSLVGDDIVFKVTAFPKKQTSATASSPRKPVKTKLLIEANFAPYENARNPQMSWGARVGLVKRAGVYARYLQNFGYTDVPSCSVDYEGNIPILDYVISKRAYCGGMMFNIAGVVYPYLGAGYETRLFYCKDKYNEYVEIHDRCDYGFTLDAGLTLRLGALALSAGVLSANYGDVLDIMLGIGFMF